MAENKWVTWVITLHLGVITYNPTYNDRRGPHLVENFSTEPPSMRDPLSHKRDPYHSHTNQGIGVVWE